MFIYVIFEAAAQHQSVKIAFLSAFHEEAFSQCWFSEDAFKKIKLLLQKRSSYTQESDLPDSLGHFVQLSFGWPSAGCPPFSSSIISSSLSLTHTSIFLSAAAAASW